MPLWTIHHTPGVFTAEQKHQLATRITDHYEQAGLPRFYVVTVFAESTGENFYIGGESVTAGVRVVIDHIARHLPDEESRARTARWIRKILQPFMDDHPGLQWEFHADETPRELWMINGLVPPPSHSEAEKAWSQANAAIPY